MNIKFHLLNFIGCVPGLNFIVASARINESKNRLQVNKGGEKIKNIRNRIFGEGSAEDLQRYAKYERVPLIGPLVYGCIKLAQKVQGCFRREKSKGLQETTRNGQDQLAENVGKNITFVTTEKCRGENLCWRQEEEQVDSSSEQVNLDAQIVRDGVLRQVGNGTVEIEGEDRFLVVLAIKEKEEMFWVKEVTVESNSNKITIKAS